jgi:hypothetical protein
LHESTSFASPLALAEDREPVDTSELDLNEDVEHEVRLILRVRRVYDVGVNDPKALNFANVKIINEEFALVSLEVDAVFPEDQVARH